MRIWEVCQEDWIDKNRYGLGLWRLGGLLVLEHSSIPFPTRVGSPCEEPLFLNMDSLLLFTFWANLHLQLWFVNVSMPRIIYHNLFLIYMYISFCNMWLFVHVIHRMNPANDCLPQLHQSKANPSFVNPSLSVGGWGDQMSLWIWGRNIVSLACGNVTSNFIIPLYSEILNYYLLILGQIIDSQSFSKS